MLELHGGVSWIVGERGGGRTRHSRQKRKATLSCVALRTSGTGVPESDMAVGGGERSRGRAEEGKEEEKEGGGRTAVVVENGGENKRKRAVRRPGEEDTPSWQWLSRFAPHLEKFQHPQLPPHPTPRRIPRSIPPSSSRHDPSPSANGSRISVLCSSGEIRRSLAQTRADGALAASTMEFVSCDGPKDCWHRRPDLGIDAAGDC